MPVSSKPSMKLKAFTEMIGEDVADAVSHDLDPGQMVVALLLYAASLSINHADIDGEDFLQYCAAAWNDRAQSVQEADYFLGVPNKGLKS